ncbi:MAG: ABC transporter ATP-binding protein [Candidatus Heimdallarchaeota archaeon]
MPTVRLEGVSKHFGRIKAVDDIDLEVQDGEYVFVLGPSGCGKTTLINCITGIVGVTRGNIRFNDIIVNSIPIESRKFAMVFQSIALFPHLLVEENVSYSAFVKNKSLESQRDISEKMLDLVDLLHQKGLKPRELSGGAQQKTALARALANDQKLLILDEPISALDYKVRVSLRYELRRLVKELGLTAIHITHDQEEAMSIADRIVIMRAGRIVEIGTPRQLYESPTQPFTMNFIGECNFLEGRIANRTGDDSYQVEFRNKQKISLKNITKSFEEEEAVAVAFRPEVGKILHAEKENALQGTVVQRRFSGGFQRYEIRLLTEDLIMIDSKAKAKVNDLVYVEIPFDNVQIFKTPKFGLRKALELE